MPSRILAHEPEVVLLGTGARQTFPAADFAAQFLAQGIGFEVMDTGAACRTFNVLDRRTPASGCAAVSVTEQLPSGGLGSRRKWRGADDKS